MGRLTRCRRQAPDRAGVHRRPGGHPMFDAFFRDLRIGARLLWKDRTFCALAVFVLALGICAVTTMFAVVNGAMLRGFSFPNADRLTESRSSIPTSVTFFGVNGQMFGDGLPGAAAAAAVLRTDGGVPRRIDGQRHDGRASRGATPARTSRSTSCASWGSAHHGPRLHGRRQQAGRRKGGAHQPRRLAARLRRRRATSSAGRCASTGSRRRSSASCRRASRFPTNEELWVPLFSEFPSGPVTIRGPTTPPSRVDQARRVARQAKPSSQRSPGAWPQPIRTRTRSSTREGRTADRHLHARAAPRHPAGRCSPSAWVCCSSRAST